MNTRARLLPSALTITLLVAGLTAVSPVRAAAPVDPGDLGLSYRSSDWRIDQPGGYWWDHVRTGSWSVERARLLPDGRLRLDVGITPPVGSLPLEPGPATLFASMSLYGDGGGDTGIEVRVGKPIHVRTRPCRPVDTCEIRARLVLPAHRIRQAAARAKHAVGWGSVAVNLVLVRTFARGSWMQVLPLEAGRKAESGTLAEPGTFSARSRYRGLFTRAQGRRWVRSLPAEVRHVPTLSIAQRQRRDGLDRSDVPSTVPVDLDVDAGDCLGWSLMTESGDVAFDETERMLGRQVHRVDVPEGSTWYVRSPSFGNIDMLSETVHTFGPFTADGAVLGLSGEWTCDPPSGDIVAVDRPADAATSTRAGQSCEPAVGATMDDDLEGTWTTVEPAPIPARFGHTATWTGDEVIIWGGLEPDPDGGRFRMPTSGAAYDPRSDTWREVSAAPIRGREGHSAVWTGSELIVWGGRRGHRLLRDGAIYDPASDSWRVMSTPSKGIERYAHHAVWTGAEMIVWSGLRRGEVRRWDNWETLAYRPSADDWEELRSPLFDDREYDAMAWTGDRLFAVAYGAGDVASVAAYEPDRDQWSKLPDVPLSSQGWASPLWTSQELLIISAGVPRFELEEPLTAVYRPADLCWLTPLALPPSHSAISDPVWSGEHAIFVGRRSVAYDPRTDAWVTLPTDGRAFREEAPVVWAGDRLFTWGGRRGEGIDALDDGVTFRPR